MGLGRVETERLVLRDIELEDADELIPVWTAPEVAQFMDDFGPRSADEVRAWVPEAVSACRSGLWPYSWVIALKDSGEVVGWIGFGGSSRPVGEVDFAYAVAPLHRNRGYASEAIAAVVDFCFHTLGVASVWAECAVGNAASAAAIRKGGLSPIGVVSGQQEFIVLRG